MGATNACIEPSKPKPREAPANTCRGQQRKFDRFQHEFNFERPHEALDMQTPASCYDCSPREMPNKIPPLEYPDRFEVRYVSANGGIRWNKRWVNVSITCVGEYVGLEEIDDGVWNVYFGCARQSLGKEEVGSHKPKPFIGVQGVRFPPGKA